MDFMITDDNDDSLAETTCKRCGKDGLEWVDCGNSWRLFDGTRLHVCKTGARADEFENVG